MFAGSDITGGKPRGSAERKREVSTVDLVRPKTRDKWLKVSHDAGSTLIHDVIVQRYISL